MAGLSVKILLIEIAIEGCVAFQYLLIIADEEGNPDFDTEN